MNKQTRWNALSMKDKAFIINNAVRLGINNLNSIRNLYNNLYVEGGLIDISKSTETEDEGEKSKKVPKRGRDVPAPKEVNRENVNNDDYLRWKYNVHNKEELEIARQRELEAIKKQEQAVKESTSFKLALREADQKNRIRGEKIAAEKVAKRAAAIDKSMSKVRGIVNKEIDPKNNVPNLNPDIPGVSDAPLTPTDKALQEKAKRLGISLSQKDINNQKYNEKRAEEKREREYASTLDSLYYSDLFLKSLETTLAGLQSLQGGLHFTKNYIRNKAFDPNSWQGRALKVLDENTLPLQAGSTLTDGLQELNTAKYNQIGYPINNYDAWENRVQLGIDGISLIGAVDLVKKRYPLLDFGLDGLGYLNALYDVGKNVFNVVTGNTIGEAISKDSNTTNIDDKGGS